MDASQPRFPQDLNTAPVTPMLRTVLLCDIVESTALVERLGDVRAVALLKRHDQLLRQLMELCHGQLIDKADGVLALFERPIQALDFALRYQRGLRELGTLEGLDLKARIGLHVGDVMTWANEPRDVLAGAKAFEVEGLAKPVAARQMNLALPGQILMSGMAQNLCHRAIGELGAAGTGLRWLMHGRYNFKGVPAPMLVHEQPYGVLIVQSYDPAIVYTKADLDLLAFMASHVAVALARMQADRRMRKAKEALEAQNAALSVALTRLQEAQSELVRQEKLASLGRLVAGVAHEINTPLGICVTATSHLVQELKLTREELAAGEMTEESLGSFFDIIDQSLRIMTTNTQRAASLVRSFKQVAVDQSSDDIRNFNLHAYLNEVLLSLQPKFKGRKVTVEVDCPKDLVLDSFPGAVSQVVTNMVMNSLVHGFEHEQPGRITMRAALEDGQVVFHYADDGAGMDKETLDKLFDPFFTTRRGLGGSGLGAHILYNLVTGALGGTVRATSAPGQGLRYELRFPSSRKKAISL